MAKSYKRNAIGCRFPQISTDDMIAVAFSKRVIVLRHNTPQ